jgi:hypothetical protein
MEQDKTQKTLKTLQLFYAGALVDAVRQYSKQGVLEAVTEAKRREQELSAPEQLKRLGINKAEDIFSTYTELFGCADWKVDAREPELRMRTKSCLACALAKKLGAPSPCAISCINPVTSQAAALDPPMRLSVEATLWEGEACVFALAPR